MSSRSLPEIIDIGDDLQRVRAETDEDEIDDDVAYVEDRLEKLAEEPTDPEGTLDQIDNRLLAMEERVGDDAAGHVRSARNRINIFRDAVEQSDLDLAIVTSKLGLAEEPTDDWGELQGEDGVLSVTVANLGDTTRAGVAVTFLDKERGEITEITSDPLEFEGRRETTVEVEVAVPLNAVDYTLSLVEPG